MMVSWRRHVYEEAGMPRTPEALRLTEGDREALELVARTRTEQARRVDRARMPLRVPTAAASRR